MPLYVDGWSGKSVVSTGVPIYYQASYPIEKFGMLYKNMKLKFEKK